MRNLNGNILFLLLSVQASLGRCLTMDREQDLGSKIVSLLAKADNVSKETDRERMIEAIPDINNLPNTTKNGTQTDREGINSETLTPFEPYGTSNEPPNHPLDRPVVTKFFSGHAITRRLGEGKFHMTSRSKRKSRTSPTLLPTLSSPAAAPDMYTEYRKNETIQTSFKRRMINSRRKRDASRARPRRSNCTATAAPTMKPRKTSKSISAIDRYDSERTKECKTELTKNYTDMTELIYYDSNVSTTPSIISKLLIEDAKRNMHAKYREQVILPNRSLLKKEAPKMERRHASGGRRSYDGYDGKGAGGDIPKRFKILNRDDVRNKDSRKLESAETSRGDTSATEDERKLNANLDDALFHERGTFPRNGEIEDVTDADVRESFLEQSSLSDEEPVLKSRIYQVFGYRDAFAEVLRQRERDYA